MPKPWPTHVLREVGFWGAEPATEQSPFPIRTQCSSMGLFLGKASPCSRQSPSQCSGSSLGACWEVGMSVSHIDCHSSSKTVSTSLLGPKVTKYHPALLAFVLLQPPALLPCSDKERPGQREGKHVFCLLLNNRGFCNTLICEAANTRKGQNSVKPLWPPEADKNFTIDSVRAVWGKPRHCLCNSGYFMSK